MRLPATLLQALKRHDGRAWLRRLEDWPAWKLFLAALVLGLLASLPWQCARQTGRPQPADAVALPAMAPDPGAAAPQRRTVEPARSILGMPAPRPAAPEMPPVAPVAAPATEPPGEGDAVAATIAQAEPVAAVAVHSPAPGYPEAAIRGREEGTVLLRVEIDAEGLPVAIAVERSSQSRLLDRAAVEAVRQWRFQPAMAQGTAVRSSLLIPISFRAGH